MSQECSACNLDKVAIPSYEDNGVLKCVECSRELDTPKEECENCTKRPGVLIRTRYNHRNEPLCMNCGRNLSDIITTNHPKLGDVLGEAKEIICGDRQDSYGSPEDSFSEIARLWNAYLSNRIVDDPLHCNIGPRDVAHMMMLLKIARATTQSQDSKRDNYVDIAGYASIAGDVL